MDIPIWTVDARNNAFLQVTQSYLGLTTEQMGREIVASHRQLIESLARKGIDYGDLRSSLTPSRGKVECAFVFDAYATKEASYGRAIYSEILRVLPRRNFSCSLLVGDLLIEDGGQDIAFDVLARSLKLHRPVRAFSHTHELFAVYINNLTPSRAAEIGNRLQAYPPYLGVMDTTYSTWAKDWLSTTLVPSWVKLDATYLGMHEDDVNDDGNSNISQWPVEDHGFNVASVPSYLYGLFLGYKIERRVMEGESDHRFSIAAIAEFVGDLDHLDILIEDEKVQYIRNHGGGGFGAAGLRELDATDLAALIRTKIRSTYVYNLRRAHHSGGSTSLFNMLLEFPRMDRPTRPPVRLLAAFEYSSRNMTIRLITLY